MARKPADARAKNYFTGYFEARTCELEIVFNDLFEFSKRMTWMMHVLLYNVRPNFSVIYFTGQKKPGFSETELRLISRLDHTNFKLNEFVSAAELGKTFISTFVNDCLSKWKKAGFKYSGAHSASGVDHMLFNDTQSKRGSREDINKGIQDLMLEKNSEGLIPEFRSEFRKVHKLVSVSFVP